MQDSVTFINHATVLIRLNGQTFLTDPVYSFSVSYFLPRLKKPGIPFELLPPIDYVLISHNHYDHLNLRTLRKIRKAFDSSIIVPRGDAGYARRAGFGNITELDTGGYFEAGGVKVSAVPAKHNSGRLFWDRNKSASCGYVLTAASKSVYFAGDTAYDPLFGEIGSKFSLDVALLPIGAYKPYKWFEHIHLNPQTAIRAFLDSKAKHLVPVHWGTFKISDEPMAEPPRLLLEEAKRMGIQDRVHVLDNGGRFEF